MASKLTPRKHLTNLERRIGIRRKHLAGAFRLESRRTYFDVISNWNEKYRELLDVAETRLRFKLGDPLDAMQEATKDAEHVAELWAAGSKLTDRVSEREYTDQGWEWASLPLRVDVVGFRFGLAALLGLLTDKTLNARIMSVVPQTSIWDEAENGFNLRNLLEAGLIEILQTGKRPPKWRPMLNFASASLGRTLLEETFECYAEIILAAGGKRWDKALDKVKHAHELYDARGATDVDLEEFEAWEGVGAGNALSVDLRLAAVMLHCFRTKKSLIDSLESIHQWPWLD